MAQQAMMTRYLHVPDGKVSAEVHDIFRDIQLSVSDLGRLF